MPSDEFVNIIGEIEAFITSAAFIIGGIWTYKKFIRKRENYPRAVIEHFVTEKSLTEDKVLIRLSAKIKNIGDVLISIDTFHFKVTQILPLTENVKRKINENSVDAVEKDLELPWIDLAIKEKSDLSPDSDKKKSLLRFFMKKKKAPSIDTKYIIEPNESEVFHVDFVVDSKIETIQLYSYITNNHIKELGWNCTTLYDLKINNSGGNYGKY